MASRCSLSFSRSNGLQRPARISALHQEKTGGSDVEKIPPWSPQSQKNVLEQKLLEESEVQHACSSCEETPNGYLEQAKNIRNGCFQEPSVYSRIDIWSQLRGFAKSNFLQNCWSKGGSKRSMLYGDSDPLEPALKPCTDSWIWTRCKLSPVALPPMFTLSGVALLYSLPVFGSISTGTMVPLKVAQKCDDLTFRSH